MLWLLLAGAVALLAWYYVIRPLNYFNRIGVKQTKPWPFLGDQWTTVFKFKGLADFTMWLYNMHPKTRYMGFYQFKFPTLMIKDTELIKQITVKDFDHFTDHRNFVDSETDPLCGRNLLILKGQTWKEMRSALSGSFSSSKMKHIFGIFNETAQNVVQFFLDKEQDLTETNLKDTYTRYTNDVIASAAFGIKVDSLAQPDNIFYNMGKRIANLNGFITRIKFFLSYLFPYIFKVFKISVFDKEITAYFRNIIEETIEVRERNGIVRPDVLNILIEVKNGVKIIEETEAPDTGFATAKEYNHLDKYKFKQLKSLTSENIASQALLFFFAGFDTTSNVLCFGSHELAVNKGLQDRLRREIIETHKANNKKLTYESLMKMKYMDMVLTEILRKWPPIIATDRVCTKPYTIEPVYPDEMPIHLQVGDKIWLPIYAIHRNPKYYPEPDKFDPERFSDKNKDNIRRYNFISFGSGPRNCIASRFAILQAKVLFYHLLLNFAIVPTKNTRIPLKLSTSVMQPVPKGGFWLGFQRIKQ